MMAAALSLSWNSVLPHLFRFFVFVPPDATFNGLLSFAHAVCFHNGFVPLPLNLISTVSPSRRRKLAVYFFAALWDIPLSFFRSFRYSNSVLFLQVYLSPILLDDTVRAL